MNFKLYHVSKNLFDNEIASGYYDADGNLIEDATTSHSTTYIPTEGGRTYTISGLWYAPGPVGMANFAVYEWDSNKNWLRRSNRQYPTSSNRITFTIGANTAYFTLQIQTTHGNIMLNEGSTALPYEPYSTEVWHDIKDYIMDTTWKDHVVYNRSNGSWNSNANFNFNINKLFNTNFNVNENIDVNKDVVNEDTDVSE